MLVRVDHDRGQACGELTEAEQRQLILADSAKKRTTLVPLGTVSKMEKVSRCS